MEHARIAMTALCAAALNAAATSGPAIAQTTPCAARAAASAAALDFAAIAARVAPTVVNLTTAGTRQGVEAPSVAVLVLRRGAMNYIAVAAPARSG